MKKLQKQILSLAIVLLLFMTNISTVYGARGYSNFTVKKAYTGFQDVASGSWYLPGIRFAFEQDLMKGSSFQTFNPNDNLSVAEAVTLAVRLYEIYYGTVLVSSAPSNPWYQKYVDVAVRQNILNPTYFSDYTAAINRADFTSLLVRLFPFSNNEKINQISILNIPDIDGGTFLADDIIAMYNYGIITGDSSLRFMPKSYISRAEVASIISRMAAPNLRKKITAPSTITAEYHVERPYEWFVDQNSSGNYSHENCGPAVTAMILQWYNQSNNATAEWLRTQIKPNGGWWYTDDIEKVMNNYQVPFQKKKLGSVSQIIDELHKNRIVMVCLDGYYISEFYDQPDSGHFILIKGYTNQNGLIRFETYNPDSRKNYYYFADNVMHAAEIWWPHFYTIGN